ncbi:MAG: molybdenum cofactor guanylyltransferase [Gammaproteobacteria bacterium]|nr:molybdenum cofactor guanylyltransferase [Gammaproteobacteria bacterium]
MLTHPTVGLILAGGRSRRLGGRDKTFLDLAGRPLIAHVIARLAPQVDMLAINSNAPPEAFAAFGLPVIADRKPGQLGPLAGIHAGLDAWPESPMITVAVDLPFLPHDLVARLQRAGGACRYASDGATHALALWWQPGQAAAVGEFLDRGGRSVRDWLGVYGTAVRFDRPTDNDLFLNINTEEDLRRAAQRLPSTTEPRS